MIRLRNAPAWLNAELEPVSVPTTLRDPHLSVVTLQQPDMLRGIDRSTRRRVLLIAQALAVEATRRGYSLKATEVKTDYHGYRRAESKDQFSIAVGAHCFGVEVRQSVDRVPHEPTLTELRDAERYSWSRIPKFDTRPGERLSAHLSGPHEHRQSKWSDSAAHALEECLPQILQEVELRAEAINRAQIAAAEERRRRWEAAIQEAKVDYWEAELGRELGLPDRRMALCETESRLPRRHGIGDQRLGTVGSGQCKGVARMSHTSRRSTRSSSPSRYRWSRTQYQVTSRSFSMVGTRTGPSCS